MEAVNNMEKPEMQQYQEFYPEAVRGHATLIAARMRCIRCI